MNTEDGDANIDECLVLSKWSRGEIEGKTVVFTEIGGIYPIQYIGELHVEQIHEKGMRMKVWIMICDSCGDPRRAKCIVNQGVMDHMERESGPHPPDFRISIPLLPTCSR
jgi:hypothetical protein